MQYIGTASKGSKAGWDLDKRIIGERHIADDSNHAFVSSLMW